MKHPFTLLLLAAATATGPAASEAAETLRNPPGTAAPVSSTLRNPLTSGASPQPQHVQSGNDHSSPTIANGGPTRPPEGSNVGARPGQAFAPSGPVGVPGVSSGIAGAGGPSVFNPSGANGGTTPGGLSAATPNGGTPTSGSKAAPMQANGVRKVQ